MLQSHQTHRLCANLKENMFHAEIPTNVDYGLTNEMQKCEDGSQLGDPLPFYNPASSCNRTEVTCLFDVCERKQAFK